MTVRAVLDPANLPDWLLEATFTHLQDGLVVTDAGGDDGDGPVIVYVNDAFTRLTGYDREEAVGQNPRFLQGALTDETSKATLRAAVAKGERVRVEILNYRRKSGPVWFDLEIVPHFTKGRITHWIATQREITQRKYMEALLTGAVEESRRRLERFEALYSLMVKQGLTLEQQCEAVVVEGVRGLGVDVGTLSHREGSHIILDYVAGAQPHSTGTRAVPYEESLAHEAVRHGGTIWCDNVPQDSRYAHHVQLAEYSIKSFITRAFEGGTRQWAVSFASYSARARPFDVEDRRYVELLVDYFSRFNEMREQSERISYLAYHCPLTGLSSRGAFIEELNRSVKAAREHGHPFGLIYLDMDGFKGVNDTMGHQAGDEVLIEAARRLRAALHSSVTIGRLGGDEFAMIIPETIGIADIGSIAESIDATFRTVFIACDRPFSLSASIGVSIFPKDADNAEELLANADEAMYRSKQSGKSQIRFYSERTA